MKLFIRSVSIIFMFFILRAISGCFNHDCPDDVYPFDFSKIKINNLDNSGMGPKVISNNTMNKAAVAFQVFISSDLSYLGQSRQKTQGFGFSEVNAFSKTKCPTYYVSNQSVERISVVTLFEISSLIPAKTEISDLFLGSDETSWYKTNLYLPLQKLSQKINHTYIDAQEVQFRLFLGREIENDSAQFIVNIEFSDSTSLSDTTHLIFIR